MEKVSFWFKGAARLSFCVVFLAFALVVAQPQQAQAATTISADRVSSYVNSLVGTKPTNPNTGGSYGGYCMAFVKDCWVNLGAGVSSACCANGYGNSHISSTSKDNIPVGADVFFSGPSVSGGPCRTCGSSYYGHIGIYVGNGNFVHAPSSGVITKSSLQSGFWAQNYRGWGFHGGVTIAAGNKGEMTEPVISLDSQWYSVGSTVTATWPATSPDTDFYQYWVVVRNLTENKTLHSGASGGAGDVSANRFSFVAGSAGRYSVTVYAVPYDKAGREKVCTKELTVFPNTAPVVTPSAKTGLTYSGSPLIGVEAGEGYVVTGGTAVEAGTYTATLTLEEGYRWADGSTGIKTVAWSIDKAAQTSFSVSAASKTVKYSKVRKAGGYSSAISVYGVKGNAPVSYSKVSKGSSSKLSVRSTSGKIFVKKGTKRGTYTIKVKVVVPATANCDAASKIVSIKVKVK